MSKFSGLRGIQKPSTQSPIQKPSLSATQKSENADMPKIGRPRAKRSDPEYTQVTAYIRKDTHLAVKRKLLDMGDVEFSDTLEELLSAWLKQK